jgi:hypothetical protein
MNIGLKSLIGRRRPLLDTHCEGIGLCFQDRRADIVGTVAIDRCVGHLYLGFGARGWNPFTQAVQDYLQGGQWQTLARYYQGFQPASLAEAYFMRNHARWSTLNDHSPYLRLKPWRASAIMMSGSDGAGNQNFGPVTQAKLAQECRKYEGIIDSIRKHGYDPLKYGPIRGYFLLDDKGDYVFRITQGMHRMPVLEAMGWTSIPIAFDPVMPRYVSLASLRHWPGVADGTFSPSLAAYMFKRHFWDRGDVKRNQVGAQL